MAEQGWRKGPWTPEEDKLLSEYVKLNGEGRWSSVSRHSDKSSQKQDKRKAQILKPEMQHHHHQQLEAGEMKMENTFDDHVKMNEAEMFHNLEDQCSSVMSQDVASWADFVVEDYYGLWGGLWNLDDHPPG
ncbi:hypothetical protein SADUNF_Sadunf04G0073800 [Salix dunnii]|uniref:Uncharacterized protein n=1 Tax=Salix dunnii TaxID=1413687 RepID=A0A835K6G2_9ROSI|nr:hypothetical protein SADUNF_Sadunf04G0073800 [Salix dunnii]